MNLIKLVLPEQSSYRSTLPVVKDVIVVILHMVNKTDSSCNTLL